MPRSGGLAAQRRPRRPVSWRSDVAGRGGWTMGQHALLLFIMLGIILLVAPMQSSD
jgi:hypothetical protein